LKLTPEEIDAIASLAVSKGGKVWFGKISADFQTTVEKMLYAPKDDVEVLRGKARALHEQITDLQKCVASQGKK
jgi:hypothetical protein